VVTKTKNCLIRKVANLDPNRCHTPNWRGKGSSMKKRSGYAQKRDPEIRVWTYGRKTSVSF
jgi:hypothetical protein